MHIVYSKEKPPYKYARSLFLAGGSLRSNQEGESWRKDALQILQDVGYDGVVFVPEPRGGKLDEAFNHSEQVEWEEAALNLSDVILFWVPRDLSLDKDGHLKLPCLTTNTEFGRWSEVDPQRCILGYPEDAERMTYLKHYADKYSIPTCSTLTETIEAALAKLGDGAERSLGERYVPLHLWQTPSFQDWYRAQTKAGNRLEDAKLLFTFAPNRKDIFLWVLKTNIYVAKEDRFKSNEFVLSRKDISSVVMWKPNENLSSSEIVLVKEFRSPASTEDGFIHEVPSGSATQETDPKENACHEVQEETGMVVAKERLQFHGARQLAGTLSSHKSQLFSVELTDEEIEWLKSQKGVIHGNKEDSEQTYIEVVELKDILKDERIDWSNLGEILSVVYGKETK